MSEEMSGSEQEDENMSTDEDTDDELHQSEEESGEEMDDFDVESDASDNDHVNSTVQLKSTGNKGDKKIHKNSDNDSESKTTSKKNEKSKKKVRFQEEVVVEVKKHKEESKIKCNKNDEMAESDDSEEGSSDGEFSMDDFGSDVDLDEAENKKEPNSKYWEDIYGRKRDKKGNVVQVIFYIIVSCFVLYS